MIRVAAVGDLHYDGNTRPRLRGYFEALEGRADLLLVAGDLTQSGTVEEVHALIEDLSRAKVPVVSVLGNHDYHERRQDEIRGLLKSRGMIALEGECTVVNVSGETVGIAGIKGFGGGFAGACVTEFGEPEIKAFASHARIQAEILQLRLDELTTDYRIALTHFSPTEETLLGERAEIYPFLGSYLLAEAIDAAGADAAFHGHAHFGTERGSTPGGIPVRNVAQTVIRHAYKIYSFERSVRTKVREE